MKSYFECDMISNDIDFPFLLLFHQHLQYFMLFVMLLTTSSLCIFFCFRNFIWFFHSFSTWWQYHILFILCLTFWHMSYLVLGTFLWCTYQFKCNAMMQGLALTSHKGCHIYYLEDTIFIFWIPMNFSSMLQCVSLKWHEHTITNFHHKLFHLLVINLCTTLLKTKYWSITICWGHIIHCNNSAIL